MKRRKTTQTVELKEPSLTIRRWLDVDRAGKDTWPIEIHAVKGDPDSISFGYSRRWSVKAALLLEAFDELDRFESRKRAKGEAIAITVPTNREEGPLAYRSMYEVSGLTLRPGDDKRIAAIQEDGLSGASYKVSKADLRYAIHHRAAVDPAQDGGS